MENVFISNILINEKQTNIPSKFQLEIKLFDLSYKEYSFLSSLMKENEIQKYRDYVYKLFKSKNILQLVHKTQLPYIKTVLDEQKNIVGLETEDGIILKNEVKFFK